MENCDVMKLKLPEDPQICRGRNSEVQHKRHSISLLCIAEKFAEWSRTVYRARK